MAAQQSVKRGQSAERSEPVSPHTFCTPGLTPALPGALRFIAFQGGGWATRASPAVRVAIGLWQSPACGRHSPRCRRQRGSPSVCAFSVASMKQERGITANPSEDLQQLHPGPKLCLSFNTSSSCRLLICTCSQSHCVLPIRAIICFRQCTEVPCAQLADRPVSCAGTFMCGNCHKLPTASHRARTSCCGQLYQRHWKRRMTMYAGSFAQSESLPWAPSLCQHITLRSRSCQKWHRLSSILRRQQRFGLLRRLRFRQLLHCGSLGAALDPCRDVGVRLHVDADHLRPADDAVHMRVGKRVLLRVEHPQ